MRYTIERKKRGLIEAQIDGETRRDSRETEGNNLEGIETHVRCCALTPGAPAASTRDFWGRSQGERGEDLVDVPHCREKASSTRERGREGEARKKPGGTREPSKPGESLISVQTDPRNANLDQ